MQAFTPDFDSLYRFECPAWFRDGKFGIWSHWGPQSVPMKGDWYARHMYVEGSPLYNHHCRVYGHPSQFGYKDLVKLWKAEHFDPEGLMELYKKAGARFFVAQAMHHDHFFNYASKIHRFNSAEVGPMKDICGLWKAAADKYNMPFGLTEHMGATFAWWECNKQCDKRGPYAGVPYDGVDPAYEDFYLDNYAHMLKEGETGVWYTQDQRWHDYWLSVMREMIDLYQPELLYSDGSLPFGSHWCSDKADEITFAGGSAYAEGLEAVSYLYNMSTKKHGSNQAVYLQKDRRPEIHRVGLLDMERSQLPGISPWPWMTDTCIGGWFYDSSHTYKRPGFIIDMLVDIISKNGSMLLNILQKPDGSIDEEARWILGELAAWFAVCAEGVYGTRPWRVYGEGSLCARKDAFSEAAVNWQADDLRFTCKGDTLFAFLMKAPENRVTIVRSLTPEDQVKSVRLLGGGALPFAQSFGALTVQLPEQLPSEYTNCIAIEMV